MSPFFPKLLKGLGIVLSLFLGVIFIFILPPVGRHYKIPSSNMSPNILVGDIIYASNFAYTFSNHKVPERGDIISFKPTNESPVFVKRVIGHPGDTVQVKDGRLYLNDVRIERKLGGEHKLKAPFAPHSQDYTLYKEYLSKRTLPISIFERSDSGPLDNTEIFKVPEGFVFVLGDNRDNSMDSRVSLIRGGAGFVPLENIIGEVRYILVPAKSCENGTDAFCPKRNFFQKL